MALKKRSVSTKKSSTTRKKPGMGGTGEFYRIAIRPSSDFTLFRTQDVGKKGGLERIAGKRPSGTWATVTWLVSKKHARISPKGELIIENAKEKSSIAKAISGKIVHVKGDVFTAHPAKNVPERLKPTPAMKKARSANIRKAQQARAKKR